MKSNYIQRKIDIKVRILGKPLKNQDLIDIFVVRKVFTDFFKE